MAAANPLPPSHVRLDLMRYAGPLYQSAGIWTMRQAWSIEPHAMSCFEIDYVHTGEVTAVLADGSQLHVHSGDLSILQPRVLHGCEHGVMAPANFLVLQVDPQPRLPCRPYSRQELGDLLRILHASGNRVVRACRGTDASFLAMRDALALPPEQQQAAWFVPWMRGLVHQMFLCIVRSLETPVIPPHFAAVDLAQRLIEQHLHEAFPVSQIARATGLSSTRLIQLFHAQTGQTPADYAMRLRLEEARRRLENPSATITDLAAELGFSSSQYFACCFRRHFSLTPTAYRRSLGQLAADVKP